MYLSFCFLFFFEACQFKAGDSASSTSIQLRFVVFQDSVVEPTVLFSMDANIAFILARFMVTIMEKTQRLRPVEKQKISSVMQLVGALITSFYALRTRPTTITFPQVQVTIG